MEALIVEMPAWQLFAAIGLSLCVAEIFMPGFVAFPIGAGFLLVTPFAFFIDALPLQLLILALAEVAVFFLIRKYKPDMTRPAIYSNAEGMIGKEGEVIEAVSARKTGYIKLYGDRWQAKTHSLQTFAVGERVIINRVDGNKVYIEPLNSTEHTHD